MQINVEEDINKTKKFNQYIVKLDKNLKKKYYIISEMFGIIIEVMKDTCSNNVYIINFLKGYIYEIKKSYIKGPYNIINKNGDILLKYKSIYADQDEYQNITNLLY